MQAVDQNKIFQVINPTNAGIRILIYIFKNGNTQISTHKKNKAIQL